MGGGFALHSAYDPQKEARRFVESLAAPFKPRNIFVIEPCLSYAAPFLRARFPKSKIFALRVRPDFSGSDRLWDGAIDALSESVPLERALFNAFGEEEICSSLFFAWPASERAFPSGCEKAWRAVKGAVAKSRDVLFTREHFASRWILNAFSLCANMEKTALIEPGSSAVVVAASGPSLESAIPVLKKKRENFFLVALSSAFDALSRARLECDACLSTDGGFYAGVHLARFTAGKAKAPLALAAESLCPKSAIRRSTVIPLAYPDGMASELLCECAPTMRAERNGTVSGTALEAALSITSAGVYFCGLDLSATVARQHCRPNALDSRDESRDCRIRAIETRMAERRFSSTSLSLYRDWFCALPREKASRVFRLRGEGQTDGRLGEIRDIDADGFESAMEAKGAPPKIAPSKIIAKKRRMEIAREFLDERLPTEKRLREIFPARFMAADRAASEGERRKAMESIDRAAEALAAKIRKALA